MRNTFLLWLFFLLTYLFVAGNGSFNWNTSSRNYFSLQAVSFLAGRIDLSKIPKDVHDLSIYNNKFYLYWGPLSAFFVIPFIVLFGRNVSDVFYTAFLGSFNPLLLYLVINKAKKIRLIPKISNNYIILISIFYAFGTVVFYLSVSGTVWFTSQIISQIPLLLSLYFLFNYIEIIKYRYFIISLICLILAFWGRYQLILYLPFHALILINKKKLTRKIVFTTIILLLLNTILFAYFNYIRFNNYWETGWSYQNYSPRFQENILRYGLINIRYIFQNAYYLLVNPINTTSKFPFISPDPIGNSIFFTSPLFILIIIGFIRNPLNSVNLIILGSSGIVIIASLVTYFTGWFQFGYRYSLDIMPLLILSLCYWVNRFSRQAVIFLFSLSIMINLLGLYWWQNIAPLLR